MRVALHLFFFFLILLFAVPSTAQTGGAKVSGRLEVNGNFFIRDSTIKAFNTPQYDRQLYGGEGWLNLNYSNWGFDFGLRFDFFNNSNLLNPNDSYSGEGIGYWFIHRDIDKLGITGGYIYDQIGSGIIFRAFEDRPLLIDNALFGLRLTYDLTPDWQVKVFTGRQKQQFNTYSQVIKGMSAEGFLLVGEEGKMTLAPGFGAVGRTLDDGTMNSIVSAINTYDKEDAFEPKYNTYAFSLFNTLSVGPVNWYVEGAYKTEDNLIDPDPESNNRFFLAEGSVLYTSLSYARKGLGITLEGKRTENFSFRTRPQELLNQGQITFIPPMARVNTYRLTARYNAATQQFGELALQADIKYAASKTLSFNLNFSNITDLEDELLYREAFAEVTLKKRRKWNLIGGVQFQQYNQEVYEVKPGVPLVEAVIPFAEYLYRFDRKKALRAEAQFMKVGRDDNGELHDYGNWIFGLLEFTIAPHWTFTISDMYNIDPGANAPVNDGNRKESKHFIRGDIFYAHNANRFSLSYVKQVEGVVCTGGICRLEPAFSGVKLTVNSSF